MNIYEVLNDETRTITDEEFLEIMKQINHSQLYLSTIGNSYGEFRLQYRDPAIVSDESFVDRLLRVCQQAKITLPADIQRLIVVNYTDKLFQLRGINKNLLTQALFHSNKLSRLEVLKLLQDNNVFDNDLLNSLIKFVFKENLPYILAELLKTLFEQRFNIDDKNIILILGALTRICWVNDLETHLLERIQHLKPIHTTILLKSPLLSAVGNISTCYDLIEQLNCIPRNEARWKRYVNAIKKYYTNYPDELFPDTQQWIEDNNL